MMSIHKPIIVFGTGRSGTTIFFQMLSEHPHVAWLSGLCEQFPFSLQYNRWLMQLLDYPVLQPYLRRRFKPSEAYLLWEAYARGFSTPCRDLRADDLSVRMKNNLLQALGQIPTVSRNRLLLKITGWPRLGYLGQLFADAKFIHVKRDGRAVANSLLNVDFWRGWGGPEKWRWGLLSPEHLQEWHQHQQSFVALAGIQWKILMEAAETAKQAVDSSRLLEIRYEDLCLDPLDRFREVADFCELDWHPSFTATLARHQLRNTNTKYQQDLTPQQQDILNAVLAEALPRFGYTP